MWVGAVDGMGNRETSYVRTARLEKNNELTSATLHPPSLMTAVAAERFRGCGTNSASGGPDAPDESPLRDPGSPLCHSRLLPLLSGALTTFYLMLLLDSAREAPRGHPE